MNKRINSLIVDDEKVAREVLENHLSKIDSIQIAGSCKNAMEAFEAMNTMEIDLIFLDINMPGMSGLSLAKMIKKDTRVIFTTAYRDYAVDGFNLKAVDYLLKPVSFERLMQGIQKYLDEQPKIIVRDERIPSADRDTYIFVRSNRKMVRVDIAEIFYIESTGDYIKIYSTGKEPVISRESLTNLEAKLPSSGFVRIHRSYITSLAQIESYTNETVTIAGHDLPLSRYYRDSFLQLITRRQSGV